MLDGKKAVATIAVKDLEAAKDFYENKLGLKKEKEEPGGGGIMYSGPVFVYSSQFAGSNKATGVSWGVGDDIEKVVEQLKSKGITFEHYEGMPNVKLEGDVHVMGELKAAWFKDPDGNIHSLVNQMQ